MKNILKSDAMDFINKVEKMLKKAKLKEIKSYTTMKNYELITNNLGRLEIHTELWEHMKGSSIYSIYICFDEPEKVLSNSCIQCNKFSGKCNIHSSNKEMALNELKELLSILI